MGKYPAGGRVDPPKIWAGSTPNRRARVSSVSPGRVVYAKATLGASVMGKGRSMRAGCGVGLAPWVAGGVLVAIGVTAAIVWRTASSVRPLAGPVGKLQADSE